MRTWIALAAGAALAFAGCEKGPPDGPPVGKPSPVHGKVTFADGSPVRGGIVIFTPLEVEAGRKWRYEGAGLIDAKGEYKAGLNGDGAGLVPGEYKVAVQPREVGELPNSNVARVPKQFRETGTTTLRVTVEEKDNSLDIVLK
jgi:hypothetical protein